MQHRSNHVRPCLELTLSTQGQKQRCARHKLGGVTHALLHGNLPCQRITATCGSLEFCKLCCTTGLHKHAAAEVGAGARDEACQGQARWFKKTCCMACSTSCRGKKPLRVHSQWASASNAHGLKGRSQLWVPAPVCDGHQAHFSCHCLEDGPVHQELIGASRLVFIVACRAWG